MATGINVTKVNDYAVIGINQGLNVSKVIEYIVLSDESFFDETPTIPGGIRATRYDISGNARHLSDGGDVVVPSTTGKISNAALFEN